MADLIDRQAAIDAIHCDITVTGKENAETVARTIGEFVDRIKALTTVQPEIIRCRDCKYMIDTGDDLMCDNAKGWVVATTSDFGCVLAERRTE